MIPQTTPAKNNANLSVALIFLFCYFLFVIKYPYQMIHGKPAIPHWFRFDIMSLEIDIVASTSSEC